MATNGYNYSSKIIIQNLFICKKLVPHYRGTGGYNPYM